MIRVVQAKLTGRKYRRASFVGEGGNAHKICHEVLVAKDVCHNRYRFDGEEASTNGVERCAIGSAKYSERGRPRWGHLHA
jgi:hypothetical protein